MQLKVPTEPRARQRLFNAMVNVSLADGRLSPREELCLRNMAGAFGMCPDEVAQTIHDALRVTHATRVWPSNWVQMISMQAPWR